MNEERREGRASSNLHLRNLFLFESYKCYTLDVHVIATSRQWKSLFSRGGLLGFFSHSSPTLLILRVVTSCLSLVSLTSKIYSDCRADSLIILNVKFMTRVYISMLRDTALSHLSRFFLIIYKFKKKRLINWCVGFE